MAKRLDAKARLLWRSELVLIDGTRLGGLAIVSYANPFDGNVGWDGAHQAEAEADLCLALEMLRNQPLHVSGVTTDRGSAPVVGVASQKQSHWVASGEVRVYIDPSERATWSFFNRIFCFDADFVEDAGQRSAQILSVSLQPSLPGFGDDGSDPFAFNNALPIEYAIFAQPATTLQQSDGADSVPVRLVLGRKVTVQTKRADAGRELSRTRSFHRQQSANSQSLHDVFTQAGLSLPMFGGGSNGVPRPDDPLPRGSITALLQARSKRKPAVTHRHRGVSPVGASTASQPALAPRTPGRRGEKRHTTSDRKVPGSPTPLPSIKSEASETLSPTKAFKHRTDRIHSDLPRLNLNKQPTRTLILPEPKLEPNLLDTDPLKIEPPSPPKPFSTITRSTPPDPSSDSFEKSNRNTIKKITHTLLTRHHLLTKSHPDYIASYHQTCSGTWCAFRHIASIQLLAKDAVEDVVRIHLSLYLSRHA